MRWGGIERDGRGGRGREGKGREGKMVRIDKKRREVGIEK